MSYQDPNQPRPYGSGPQQPYSPPPGGPYPPQQPPPGGTYPPQYPQAGQPPGYGYASPPGQPGFGAPPGPGYGRKPGPPGVVIAAAVIAFGLAALELFIALLLFGLGAAYTVLSPSEKEEWGDMVSSGLFFVVAVVSLIMGAVLIWGGVWTLQGRSSKVLFFTAVALLALSVLNVVLGQFGGGALAIVACVAIVVLLQLQPSKQFFASRRGSAS